MSYEYDQYLAEHKNNVKKGFKWFQDNLPEILKLEPTPTSRGPEDLEWQICLNHDSSKTEQDEYAAYDAYFYGNGKSFKVVQDFNRAWLNHIHRNQHHWQHWVLIEDDAEEGMVLIDIPNNYIIEMICDWWSFSWKTGDLTTIFDWYDEHKDYMKISLKTKQKVESILDLIKDKLEEEKDE